MYAGAHRLADASRRESGDAFAPEWKRVAIKKSRPNKLDTRNGRDKIKTYDKLENQCQEIKALLRLQGDSPGTSNVLYMYECFLSGDDFYIVTERLDEELEDWKLRCVDFTEDKAIAICRTILQSLIYISEKKVVHRDVKLKNILFRIPNDFSSLKLIDFGLAHAFDGDEFLSDLCGSTGSIAPEIYSRAPYRFEVDMFAFGVLLFQLLSRGRPFPVDDERTLELHTVTLQYDVHSEDWENVSSPAKDLVRKLLINRD